jgi:hypothetical protein
MGGDLLQKLRDIHYPAPIPIWPLAIGWYLLLGLILIALAALSFYFYRKWVKEHLKRVVLRRLQELQSQQNANGQNIYVELSMLLKRAALASYPRALVAGLHGEQWLSFLDKTAMTQEFTQGPGRLLIVCPYKGKPQELPVELFHLIQGWVKKNL